MLKLIKQLLNDFIERIDSGLCELDLKELKKLLNYLATISDPNSKMTKSQSAEYIGVSPSSFDKYVQIGLIPRGEKIDKCQKTLYWDKFDLDAFLDRE